MRYDNLLENLCNIREDCSETISDKNQLEICECESGSELFFSTENEGEIVATYVEESNEERLSERENMRVAFYISGLDIKNNSLSTKVALLFFKILTQHDNVVLKKNTYSIYNFWSFSDLILIQAIQLKKFPPNLTTHNK